MLKVNLDDKTGSSLIIASGTPLEITNEVAIVINSVYTRFAKSSHPGIADMFKRVLLMTLNEKDSAVFQVDESGFGISANLGKVKGDGNG